MSEKRKLKKPELMLISRILDKLNFKLYSDSLLKKIENGLNSDIESLEIQTALIVGDIGSWVVTNAHLAESEIDKLICSFKSVKQEYVNDMDVDEYIETLKDIFQSGVPKVLTSMMNNENFKSLYEIKKKLTDLQ